MSRAHRNQTKQGGFVNSETIEKTPAEERKEAAAASLKKLETERAQIPTRKQDAEAAIERLHQEIVAAERAGADAKTLAALRRQRTEHQQTIEDLARMCPGIERDLELAGTELRAATIACHADRYNELVKQQNNLTELLYETIDTIVETIKAKESLAHKQRAIQIQDIGSLGFQYAERSPADLRRAFLTAITERLTDTRYMNELTKRSTVQKIDWPSWKMRADGELE